MAFRTLNRVKVNGPHYANIVRGKELVADILPPPEYIVETYLVALQLVQEKDPAQREQLIDRCAGLRTEFQGRHEYWEKVLPEGPMKDALLSQSYGPAMEFYDLLEKKFLPAIKGGDSETVLALASGPMKDAFARHRAAIEKTVTLANTYASDTETRAAAEIESGTRQLLGIVGGVLLVVAAVTVVVARGITMPLRNLFMGLRAFSTNELKHVGDQFGQIAQNMTEAMAQVKDAAAQVASASQHLASGASEQASSLEETSSALEQMAATTSNNAKHAEETQQLATQARGAAESGQRVITAIGESSSQVAKIIKVIEEIAFQTNILALNAAVEAARAGEHGKGFAVVAEEVRNLARRAAEAARDTTAMIEDSVNKAKDGTHAIEEIVASVTRVSELINGIAQTSREQAQGVEQLNTAVAEMDKVVQSNAAQAEQSASAAQELSAQSRATEEMVAELLALTKGSQPRHAGAPSTGSPKAEHSVAA